MDNTPNVALVLDDLIRVRNFKVTIEKPPATGEFLVVATKDHTSYSAHASTLSAALCMVIIQIKSIYG